MALSVTVDTDHNLLDDDLDLVKSYLGESLTGSDEDELLKFLINSVSFWARRYLNNFGAGTVPLQVKKKAITEYYDGDGSSILLPNSIRVNTISNIYDDLDRAYGADTEIDSSDLVIINNGTQIKYDGGVFLKGYQNIKAVLNCGYDPIPWDMQQAALVTMAFLYKEYKESRWGITTRNIADGSMSIETSKLPKETRETWDFFVKKW